MSSFTFDFDLADDLDDQFDFAQEAPTVPVHTAKDVDDDYQPFAELPITKLLSSLPESISYSPLVIHLTSAPSSSENTQNGTSRSVILARRDLFDARLQLIASSTEEQENDEGRVNGLDFIEAPSDLVPGVYEGGLKTWECSMDLVDYLYEGILGGEAGKGLIGSVRGKRILEIGCGTAVPSLYLMQQLFASLASTTEHVPDSSHPALATHFHLQDYNRSVLELVTLPNIILTWYMSPLSASYRSTLPLPTSSEVQSGEENTDNPNPSPSTPGELIFTPALLSAFTSSLSQQNVHLQFFIGSWDGFDVDFVWRSDPPLPDDATKRPYYDLVLTSETIYRIESLPALLRVLRSASSCTTEKTLEERTADLSLDGATNSAGSKGDDGDREGICLVAAKVLYFGVGGGVQDFARAIEDGQHVQDERESRGKGSVETVWERKDGVGRKIMRVRWR